MRVLGQLLSERLEVSVTPSLFTNVQLWADLATMKRKLDGGNSPAPVSINDSHGSHGSSGFGSLRLDPRLQQAVLKEQFLRPTPIQSKVIPLALEGRDILGTLRVILNDMLAPAYDTCSSF